ncbi:hypothetical protein E2C01_059929 [Portunus trituberculatus]|uniref:Uncharacterized protein n=1 Tax=Portunus trituberculatus TaxID=210409 RepID=A0A5B7H6Q6_PORTR|nr:hypothetical protein [Portunus trituberculatus]
MFGRELRLPVDLATGRPPDVYLPTVDSVFAAALQERLAEAHREVRGKLRMASRAMKELYDRRMRDARYTEGNRVCGCTTPTQACTLAEAAEPLGRALYRRGCALGGHVQDQERSQAGVAMEDVPKKVEEAVDGDAGGSQLLVETAARPVRYRRPLVYLKDFELS